MPLTALSAPLTGLSAPLDSLSAPLTAVSHPLPGIALQENLLALVSFNQISGVPIDHQGNLTIAQGTAAPTSVAGKLGLANRFAASTDQFWTVAASSAIDFSGVSFGAAVWVYPDEVSQASQGILNKYVTTASNREWRFYLEGTTAKWSFLISRDGSSASAGLFQTGAVAAAETWQHIGFAYDYDRDEVRLYVDGARVVTGTYAGGAHYATQSLTIGRTTAAAAVLRGRLDALHLFKGYAPSDNDMAFLYNEGAGREWPR